MMKQALQQKLLQKLSPQQIQLMKLLQVPTASLEQRIKEEIQNNPALEEEGEENTPETEDEDSAGEETGPEEEPGDDDFDIGDYFDEDDDPSYKTSVRNTGPDEEKREIPFAASQSFQETLLSQLGMCHFDDRQYRIAEYLTGNIDEDGYLRRPLPSIVNDLAVSYNLTTDEHELELILSEIQTFDPPGTGARDLRECLILQLKRKNQQDHTNVLALKIVSEQMEAFSRKHYDKIAKHFSVDEEHLKEAIHEILKLNPRPGNTFADNQRSQQHLIPDFIMTNNDGILELSLNSRNTPELKLSGSYLRMLESYSKEKKNKPGNREAIQFIKQKLDSAQWFIDAINQRQQTLLTVMSAIMEYQREYFIEGDETKLRPMILKDIAEIVKMDISTISRVANSKYIQTHFGTFLLKSFFSESLQTQSGEEVSSREVKKILSDCIEAEDKKKPLPDEKLMAILKEKGYNIARRTVAKYREQLNIPVARLRKKI